MDKRVRQRWLQWRHRRMEGTECVRWVVTQDWRGRPLVNHEAIINVFVGTTMRTGLKIRTELDHTRYPTRTRVREEEVAAGNATLFSRALLRSRIAMRRRGF